MLNRSDQINDLIVIMSKRGKQKRDDQIKTTTDCSAVVTQRLNYYQTETWSFERLTRVNNG